MILLDKLRRPSALAVAALLFAASLLPLMSKQKVEAYGLLGNRQITMSSSADGSTPDGQGVDYEVQFDVSNGAPDIEGVVVDFCGNTPILGDACSAPTGFDVSAATLTLGVGLAGFTKDAVTTTDQKFVLSGAPVDVANGETIRFTLEGVDNPENVNTSFYARIITFSTDEGAENYDSSTAANTPNPDNPGAEPPVIDAGGIALSTAEQITITSKVQEKLTFCVYTDGNGDTTVGDSNYTNCTVSGAAVTLGDENGVLSEQGEFVDDTAMYNVSTNASQGVAIRIKGTTLKTDPLCADTPAEPCSIDVAGDAAVARDPGEEQFGFCTYEDLSNPVPGGLTAAAPYNHADCNSTDVIPNSGTSTAGDGTTAGLTTAQIAFDTETVNSAASINSVYGQTFASKVAGGISTGILVFSASINPTTEPGIYRTTLTFIATGTY